MADTTRTVTLTRLELGRYQVTNSRGHTLTFGTGTSAEFAPVELLLAALAGCSAADVDYLTSRRAEPEAFEVTASGEKIRDAGGGNRMTDLHLEFAITFPEGEAGDRAREMLPRAVDLSQERLCTVTRTVSLGTPVTTGVTGADDPNQATVNP